MSVINCRNAGCLASKPCQSCAYDRAGKTGKRNAPMNIQTLQLRMVLLGAADSSFSLESKLAVHNLTRCSDHVGLTKGECQCV